MSSCSTLPFLLQKLIARQFISRGGLAFGLGAGFMHLGRRRRLGCPGFFFMARILPCSTIVYYVHAMDVLFALVVTIKVHDCASDLG